MPQAFSGTPFGTVGWRFNLAGSNAPATDVSYNFTGANVAGQPIFPIPILLVLIYYLLIKLCEDSVGSCISIAKTLSGASIDLSKGGENLMSSISGIGGGGGAGGGGSSNPSPGPGNRPGPGPGPGPSPRSDVAEGARDRVPGVGERGDGVA